MAPAAPRAWRPGTCGHVLANYLPPPAVSSLPGQIPESLVPPLPLTLTVEQQSFAGGWLSGFPLLADEAGSCHVSL